MSVPSKTGGPAAVVCRASLLPVQMPTLGPKVFIWGEPVLRRYYTVYHAGRKEIGFAVAKQQEAAMQMPNSIVV